MAASRARSWTSRRPSRTSADGPSRPSTTASRSTKVRAKPASTRACMITEADREAVACAGVARRARFDVVLRGAALPEVDPRARVSLEVMYSVCHTGFTKSKPPAVCSRRNPAHARIHNSSTSNSAKAPAVGAIAIGEADGPAAGLAALATVDPGLPRPQPRRTSPPHPAGSPDQSGAACVSPLVDPSDEGEPATETAQPMRFPTESSRKTRRERRQCAGVASRAGSRDHPGQAPGQRVRGPEPS